MIQSEEIIQHPLPGEHIVHYAGDMVTFRLSVPNHWQGTAWLRTNIGHADIQRQEIINEVDYQETSLGRDWFDIPMQQCTNGEYQLVLGLTEVGHFEAKAYFLPGKKKDPLWPTGHNTIINVDTAEACCANSIYNAFVRQFGRNKSGLGFGLSLTDKQLDDFDKSGFTVIPPSGTFRDLRGELDFIINELGCRHILLLPIHPTPTTYARMGRFGSPYAALSFTAVDPALAEFDPKATPLEQFIELVDAVHAHQGSLLLDIAINHTGWAAGLHESHPQWLARSASGQIENPGAWGVIWGDLTRLDYGHKDLWQYMANIFLTWCRRGVDGFRADAGYMIPDAAWRYIIAKVRQQYPDTIFLLEGLGGPIASTRQLLNYANFNWAYSELFQNYDRSQLEHYLPEALDISQHDGITVHFCETHDNNRLAATSPVWARLRTTLCALLSPQGGFGFANGVEWLATEKISVHGSTSLNWGSIDNQVALIHRLNTLLKHHPVFTQQGQQHMLQTGPGNFIVVRRHPNNNSFNLLIVANLDTQASCQACWPKDRTHLEPPPWYDLLSGNSYHPVNERDLQKLNLKPGQVLCLTDQHDMIAQLRQYEKNSHLPSAQLIKQRIRSKVLKLHQHYQGCEDLRGFNLDEHCQLLQKDPRAFCTSITPFTNEPYVITWRYPQDQWREVMIPPQHMLLVRCPYPFHLTVGESNKAVLVKEQSFHQGSQYITVIEPLNTPIHHQRRILKIKLYTTDNVISCQVPLCYLADGLHVKTRNIFFRNQLLDHPHLWLGTNNRGGMSRASSQWGLLRSRYDAALAANLHPEHPDDRWIMLSRIRGWLNYQGFTQTISQASLDAFGCQPAQGGYWLFHLPVGQGQHVLLKIGMAMIPEQNAVQWVIYRCHQDSHEDRLADQSVIDLVLRPDIENRNFHETTKAYTGLESNFPKAILPNSQGFRFTPDPYHQLTLQSTQGKFHVSPEWHYMVYRPLEGERGLDPVSDLYCPGYFAIPMAGGEMITLTAQITAADESPKQYDTLPVLLETIKGWIKQFPSTEPLPDVLKPALQQFIVRRGQLQTVIAGYPWFLDWGRDTLIVVRGIIAAKNWNTAESIILQFAQFEENGTLPNMIRGSDASNRDTSDAPLWLFVACNDLWQATGRDDIFGRDCAGRSLHQVLVDLANGIIKGTPNQISMDEKSGLIFSPSHFTWMDTNYPAGTPRQGYPIEIQALWFAALQLLSKIAPHTSRWADLAAQVKKSITQYYYFPEVGYLADCLHCVPDTPAAQAKADNALRPNQLYAITLGAVSDPDITHRILEACEQLLVPGAIRTLADQPVQPPLTITFHGKPVNNPQHPYFGHYRGDEDTCRKPAYHNGTAWTWVFPAYAEAWVECYGPKAVPTALAWLGSASLLMDEGCVGQLPEIVDGNLPHKHRGCDAQAWGVSELLRVWRKLTMQIPENTAK